MKKLLLLITGLAASAGFAQPPQAPQRSAPGTGPNAGLDMNEMVCRTQSVIGSRLTHSRTCATRQQWLEQQRMDRLYTEKAQTNRFWPGP